MIIPALTQHYAMLQRNLLYAGVTRGKKLVVLVGQKKAVAIAVRNVSGRKRWSKASGCSQNRLPLGKNSTAAATVTGGWRWRGSVGDCVSLRVRQTM